MPFNKIQPEQVQMPTFFSNSGDILFDQSLDTGVKLNISRGLTGEFNITGQVTVNSAPVLAMANTGTNTYLGRKQGSDGTESGQFILLGENNTISGVNDIIVNGVNTLMSGDHNVSLNGNSQTFGINTAGCTVLAGDLASFNGGVSGAVIIKDTKPSSSLTANTDNTLNIQFSSGTYFHDGAVYFLGGSDIVQDSNGSGFFSGDLNVLGKSFVTGSYAATESWTSGNFLDISGNIAQEVTGQKTFRDDAGLLFQLPSFQANAGEAWTALSGQIAMSGKQFMVRRHDGNWTGISTTPITYA